MSAWAKQIATQVKKHGKRKASWYCVWDEPTGKRRYKSHGPGSEGRQRAQMQADQIRGKLAVGHYDEYAREQTTWEDFIDRYTERVLQSRAPATLRESLVSLNHFSRILKLKGKPLTFITTDRVAEFVAKRRAERGKLPKSTVTPATLNKDLRMVKAAIRKAHEWELITKLPKFEFVREPEKLPTYVKPEHFNAIYKACESATQPVDTRDAATWWRSLLMFAYLTGWRIGEILYLRWEDVDMVAGTAITRAENNKGNRDSLVRLHPVAIEHLEAIQSFDDYVFPWSRDRKALQEELDRIQGAAKIDEKPLGARYTFHDFRRAFATMNALNMSEQALQTLMRHASPLTTKRYVNVARQLSPAVANLYVPDVG